MARDTGALPERETTMIRRTAAITAASIAGVILAGGAAVGANIGILNAADDNSLGELSAQAPISTSNPDALIDAFVDVNGSADSTQSFAVDSAGTIEIESDGNVLRLRDVRVNEGWSWEDTSTDAGALTVTFNSGEDTLLFSATPNADGTIGAKVDRPVIATLGQQAPTLSDYDDDDVDDDDEHDEYDDDEHEGRDEDD